MNARTITFAQAQSRYDAMLPPANDRAYAVEREAERIEADADKVRKLIADNIGAIDSPVCAEFWPVETLIAMRELHSVFSRLTHGAVLMDALKSADDSRHFQTLLRNADVADSWIAELIRGAAADAVDTVEDDE